MGKKKDAPDKCPKCGCQVFDPFQGTTMIHNIEKCGGTVKPPTDEEIIILPNGTTLHVEPFQI